LNEKLIEELIKKWKMPNQTAHDLKYAFGKLLHRKVIREDEISMELVCGFFNVFARFCYCHNYDYPSYKLLAEKFNCDERKIEYYGKFFHPACNSEVKRIFEEIKEKKARSPHEKFLARR